VTSLRRQFAAGGKAVGIVGLGVDEHVTLEAVGPSDPSYENRVSR
jgi:hypothetical protein